MNNEDFNKLKSNDLFSFILFALFKVKDVKEYSTLSELAFILDRQQLLNLCLYFGGMTITIPTIEEVETLIYALLMYLGINLLNKPIEQVVGEIQLKSYEIKDIKNLYYKLCDLMEDYNFGRNV